MKPDPWVISERLADRNRQFSDFESSGLVMDGEGVRELRRQLRDLTVEARQQGNELSRLLWNALANDAAPDAETVLAEAARPGSNVFLLAPRERPFSDGAPR